MRPDNGLGEASLSPLERLEVEVACERLTRLYCAAADDHDLDLFLSIFDPAASWERPAGKLVGHEEIARYFAQRPRDEFTCHVVSNVLITATSATTATGRSVATVYRSKGARTGIASLRPSSIVGYSDEYLRSASGVWKISARSSRTILREA
jgi:hypothetical protein